MAQMTPQPPTRWKIELYGDELAVLMAVQLWFVEEHKDDPEAQEHIQVIRNITPAIRIE